MSMHVQKLSLPQVAGWPYTALVADLAMFQYVHRENPGVLWIGKNLWALLRKASDSEEFFTHGIVPIKLDMTGILEPNEFIFMHA